MKLSCGTVRDLLPAYSDKTASPTTMLLVKEHLRGCPDCRRELDAIHRSANKPAQQEAAAHELNYVGLSKKLRRRRIIICAAILLAAVWAVLFTIDYARFNQGEPLKFAIHSHQDYGEEGTVDVYYGLGYKMTDYKLTRGRIDRAFGTLLMRTDTARLTEEELVQVEEAVGAWVLENGAYDYDRENLSYTIIGNVHTGAVLGIERYGTENTVIYLNACTADLDEQGVVQNTTISLYRVEADMTETPMQIRLIERYTDLLEPVPDAETKEDIVRSYRKQLAGKFPRYIIDLYEYQYDNFDMSWDRRWDRQMKKAWKFRADYLATQREETQP